MNAFFLSKISSYSGLEPTSWFTIRGFRGLKEVSEGPFRDEESGSKSRWQFEWLANSRNIFFCSKNLRKKSRFHEFLKEKVLEPKNSRNYSTVVVHRKKFLSPKFKIYWKIKCKNKNYRFKKKFYNQNRQQENILKPIIFKKENFEAQTFQGKIFWSPKYLEKNCRAAKISQEKFLEPKIRMKKFLEPKISTKNFWSQKFLEQK